MSLLKRQKRASSTHQGHQSDKTKWNPTAAVRRHPTFLSFSLSLFPFLSFRDSFRPAFVLISPFLYSMLFLVTHIFLAHSALRRTGFHSLHPLVLPTIFALSFSCLGSPSFFLFSLLPLLLTLFLIFLLSPSVRGGMRFTRDAVLCSTGRSAHCVSLAISQFLSFLFTSHPLFPRLLLACSSLLLLTFLLNVYIQTYVLLKHSLLLASALFVARGLALLFSLFII